VCAWFFPGAASQMRHDTGHKTSHNAGDIPQFPGKRVSSDTPVRRQEPPYSSLLQRNPYVSKLLTARGRCIILRSHYRKGGSHYD